MMLLDAVDDEKDEEDTTFGQAFGSSL